MRISRRASTAGRTWPALQCALAAAALLLIAPLVKAQEQAPAHHLVATGNEEALWVVLGTWEATGETFVNLIAYMDKGGTSLRQVRGVRPQIGHVVQTAPVGESLHVFYRASGYHHRYTSTSDRRELRLPDAAVPMAIAGERIGTLPRLWAVVMTDTADAVAADYEKHLREQATQPAEEPARAPQDIQAVIGALPPTDRLHLVRYESLQWQPGLIAPEESIGSERVWLAVAGRQHLLWQKQAGELEIHYAWHGRQGWTQGPSLALDQPLESAFLGINNNQLIFVALSRDGADPQHLRPAAWVRQEDAWLRLPDPLDEHGQPLLLPPGSRAVTAFADDLAIFRMHEGRPEVGFWRLMSGGAAAQPFQEVPFRALPAEPGLQRGMEQFLITVVIAGLLALVLWRRQESLANPLQLPEGMTIARPGKRAVAALIDIAPAAVFVGVWWAGPLQDFYHALRQAVDPIALPRELAWAWFTLTLLYTVYCTLFELLWSRTPGKWLLGCEVLSESLSRPAALQVVIRNGSRLLELERHLMVWPFLLVIFFTRNRQRIGDLIARTVVVERQPVESQPGTESRQDDDTVEAGRSKDRE